MGSLSIHRLTFPPSICSHGSRFLWADDGKSGWEGQTTRKEMGLPVYMFKYEGGALGFDEQFEHRSIYDVPKQVQ